MATAMTPNDFRSGNRNSPERFETDSKPMNSHGMKPTIPSTCTMRGTPSGANAGPAGAVKPPWRQTAAPAKTRMPATKATDRTVCTLPARRRRQQIAAATAMATAERRMLSSRIVMPSTA